MFSTCETRRVNQGPRPFIIAMLTVVAVIVGALLARVAGLWG